MLFDHRAKCYLTFNAMLATITYVWKIFNANILAVHEFLGVILWNLRYGDR